MATAAANFAAHYQHTGNLAPRAGFARESRRRDRPPARAWVILPAMSLTAAIAEAGRALSAARGLYGANPTSGEWTSTPALTVGRDGVYKTQWGAQQSWHGDGAGSYTHAAGHGAQALDRVTSGDAGTGHGFKTGAAQAVAGRRAVDALITETRDDLTALAPSAGTPAGRRELITHLQGQLHRANALLRLSRHRDTQLAALIRTAAAGYGRATAPAFPVATGFLGPQSAAQPPKLAALSRLFKAVGGRPARRSRQERSGLHLAAPDGAGPERIRAVIRKALDLKGITDPAARARWERGMLLVAQRESGFNAGAVNLHDTNAVHGDASAGTWQFTSSTFRAYHEPGTSTNHTDDLAQACAFINYAQRRYHVHIDGSNLAANIQQADPTRPPHGY